MDGSDRKERSGLTLRSLVVAVVAMFAMAVWIEYVEKFCAYGGPLAENFPPNAAVGVILAVMAVSALLCALHRPLRLSGAELVVVYCALVLAAPLCSQGLWGRFFGLLAAIPNNQDFKSYDSMPPMLWPHGENLVRNGRFRDGLDGFRHEGGGRIAWTNVDRGARGEWRSPVLDNGGDTNARVSLVCSIPRRRGGREILTPGERFLFSMLVRAEGLQKDSLYFAEVQADSGPVRSAFVSTSATRPTFANPCGFERVGASPIAIPVSLTNELRLIVGLEGPGRLTLQDIEFMNVEAIEGLYSGRKLVSESGLSQLDESERDFTVVKPDSLFSLRGLKYLAAGLIPVRDWARPMAMWGALFGALFAGLLGLNILMRRQWAENERLLFPLALLPRHLLSEDESAVGEARFPIFRNRAMWLGFAMTLPLVILRGLHFYNPSIPAPVIEPQSLSQLFSGTLARAYFQDVSVGGSVGAGFSFSLLSIALMMDTGVLLSLWVGYFAFQLWNLFGKAFNLTKYPGYPWRFQQTMGGYLAYAALAVFMGRRHIVEVARVVLGRDRSGSSSALGEERGRYRLALLLVAASLCVLAWWGAHTRMGWPVSLLFFGYMLSVGFVASRLRAECGAPFSYMTPYYGMQFVAAAGGFAVFGATGMLVATICSGFMTTSSFLLMSPTQVEMMELGRHLKVRQRDVWAGLALGLLGGVFIGGFTVLCWGYGFGANSLETLWPYQQNWYFHGFRTGEAAADRAFEAGTLFSTPETRPMDVFHNLDAKGLAVGAGITWLLALLRGLFVWFPLHPIGYVLASTHMMSGLWLSVLIAWAVRVLILRLGGTQAIRKGLVPFCVGMFLACVVSIIFFDAVGLYLRSMGISNVYAGMP